MKDYFIWLILGKDIFIYQSGKFKWFFCHVEKAKPNRSMRFTGTVGEKCLSELLFHRDSTENVCWRCKRGTRRKQNCFSFANLISNINTVHPEHNNRISTDLFSFKMSADHFFMNKKSTHHCGWLKLVVHELLPFHTFKKNVFANNPSLSRCLLPLWCSAYANWHSLLKKKFSTCNCLLLLLEDEYELSFSKQRLIRQRCPTERIMKTQNSCFRRQISVSACFWSSVSSSLTVESQLV